MSRKNQTDHLGRRTRPLGHLCLLHRVLRILHVSS